MTSDLSEYEPGDEATHVRELEHRCSWPAATPFCSKFCLQRLKSAAKRLGNAPQRTIHLLRFVYPACRQDREHSLSAGNEQINAISHKQSSVVNTTAVEITLSQATFLACACAQKRQACTVEQHPCGSCVSRHPVRDSARLLSKSSAVLA